MSFFSVFSPILRYKNKNVTVFVQIFIGFDFWHFILITTLFIVLCKILIFICLWEFTVLEDTLLCTEYLLLPRSTLVEVRSERFYIPFLFYFICFGIFYRNIPGVLEIFEEMLKVHKYLKTHGLQWVFSFRKSYINVYLLCFYLFFVLFYM